MQWKESADSWDTETDVSETTVTGTTHTITSLTGGVEYAVRVIATNVAGDGPASTEARATPADSPTSGEEGTETGESDSTAAWTATLTVGVSGSGSEAVWGYSWFLDGMGTLDERTYSEGDQTIEVMAILLSNGFVAFNVRPHPSVDFVLTVDGTEFASADASEVKSRTLISYVWATTLDWAEDDRVALSLTLKDTDSAEQSEPAENTPATGLPTISGTPQVDQTLTADTSAIADADGLTNVSYRYQWIAGGTDIDRATGSSYLLTSSEQGKTVQVRVTFTDDDDNDETLTSVATVAVAAAPNHEATGKPTIGGTPQVGETLTADTATIADQDGLTGVSYRYQWIAGELDISGATSSTYTLSSNEQRKTIQVKVSFTDDADNQESLTSAASDTVAATKPGIPGHLHVSPHDTGALDVYWHAPASDGGSAITGYKVQWKENADSWETPAAVSEATVTGTTHTITGLTDGVEYTVRVRAVNDVGEGAPSSEASGTPQEEPIWSTTLTVGVAETFAGYTTFLPDSTVLGALSSDTITLDDASYTVKALGVLNGKLILSVIPKLAAGFVLVVGTDEFASTDASTFEGDSTTQFQWNDPGLDLPEGEEVAVRVTAPDDNSPAAGLPTINGTPQVGVTLTAGVSGISDEDGLTNVSYSYQWIRSDGNTNADIEDATDSTYEASNDDLGQTIKVQVTFTDDANNEESLTSEATVTVAARSNTAPTGLPTISGTPQVEQTLTADTSGIADADGLTNVSYRYQWIAGGSEIAGATGSSYTLTSSEQGQTVQVRVTFTDDADNAESLTGEATTAVAARPTPAVLLTASFADVPADHNGGSFTFQLTFSENVDAGYARIRNHALTVTSATIDSASRITQGSNQGWNVEVNPTGNGTVTITLPETTNCSDAGAICTDDSRKLSRSTSATVAGPPAISVSDATVQEAEGAVLVFTATLSHASSRTVTVDYATSDGTAVAGSDYTAASGALTFNAGDTSQTVQVTVLTDSEDESQETLTLTLSNPSQATLDDATGTGAIENGESSSGIQEDPPAETPVVLLTASFANVPAYP